MISRKEDTIALALRNNTDHGLAFIVPAVERVKAFCRKYDTDNEPELLGRAILRDFFDDGGRFFLAVALSDDVIVGHILICIAQPEWGTERRLQVLQHWYDEGFNMPIRVSRQIFDVILKWGRDNGIFRIDTVAIDPKIARRLRIFYGFKDDMQQLTRCM